MAFLFSFFFALIATTTFFIAWKAMPAIWLFDSASLSDVQRHRPHPRANTLSLIHSVFIVFPFFCTVSLHLMKKVPLMDVFWGLSLRWLLTQIALSDWYYRLIPDQWSAGIAIPGILRLLHNFTNCNISSTSSCLTIVPSLSFCLVILLFLYLIPYWFSGTPAMGLGDMKLIAALSITLPPHQFFTLMISSALLGGAVAIIILLNDHLRGPIRENGIPYGTVIAVAFLKLIA